jgi:hypothetical protein
MPRPAEGYRLQDGTQVPGVTDITKNHKDANPLIMWARKDGFDQAKAGAPKPNHYSRAALDIGTVVHGMIELHLRGRNTDQIETYGRSLLREPAEWTQAFAAFNAFRKWAETLQIGVSEMELSLVSEKHRYGGTLDVVGMVGRRQALLDFKTRKTPVAYAEDLVQLAAYGQLWEERFPDRALTGGYFLICLPKDGSSCVPFHYPDLKEAGRLFAAYRYAYDIERALASPDFLNGQAVAPALPRDVINLAEVVATPPAPKPAAPSVERKLRKKALVMGGFTGYAATVQLDGWESFRKASA